MTIILVEVGQVLIIDGMQVGIKYIVNTLKTAINGGSIKQKENRFIAFTYLSSGS